MKKYDRIIAWARRTPWAIRDQELVTLRTILTERAAGIQLSDEELAARIGAGPSTKAARAVGNVAVIPLWGVIVPKADLFSEMSGGTSIEKFRGMFRAALAEPQFASILIDVDSPGGSTDQVAEMAAEIFAARGKKPITAIANTDAASAAYWLGSQADEFVITPSGFAGSIGVWAAHEDWSRAEEMAGVKTTLIFAGEKKIDGNPFEPLSDRARKDMQTTVDEFYDMFVGAVAKGRDVTTKDVRKGFGQGAMLTAKDAVAQGLADAIATFDDTVARMASGKSATGRRAEDVSIEVHGDVVSDELAAQVHRGLKELGDRQDQLAQMLNRARATEETDPEPAVDPEPETHIVPGAEQLLRRRGIREAFAPR